MQITIHTHTEKLTISVHSLAHGSIPSPPVAKLFRTRKACCKEVLNPMRRCMQKIKKKKNEQKTSLWIAVRPTAPSTENHTSQLLREVKEMPLLGYAAKSLHNSTHTRAGRDAKLQVTVVECPERNLLPALLNPQPQTRGAAGRTDCREKNTPGYIQPQFLRRCACDLGSRMYMHVTFTRIIYIYIYPRRAHTCDAARARVQVYIIIYIIITCQ